jgi:hypothetical protein
VAEVPLLAEAIPGQEAHEEFQFEQTPLRRLAGSHEVSQVWIACLNHIYSIGMTMIQIIHATD